MILKKHITKMLNLLNAAMVISYRLDAEDSGHPIIGRSAKRKPQLAGVSV
jgi:hypothetical protein